LLYNIYDVVKLGALVHPSAAVWQIPFLISPVSPYVLIYFLAYYAYWAPVKFVRSYFPVLPYRAWFLTAVEFFLAIRTLLAIQFEIRDPNSQC